MTEQNHLDNVIAKTIAEVEQGKEDLFTFSDFMRSEYEVCQRQLMETRLRIDRIINEVDDLEQAFIQSREHLQAVQRGLEKYSRKAIWKAHEVVYQNMMELMRKQESEKILRLEREHLENNMKVFNRAWLRSEELMAAISMALKVLNTDLNHYSTQIGEARHIQNLGLSIIQAQEEERRRIARDIHDGPAQSLANIVMRAEYCLKLMEVNPEQVKEELLDLMLLVRSNLEDVRKIIFDLRPMSLDDLGLLSALKRYTEQFVEDYDLYVELNIIGRVHRLDNTLEIALFRIIQESLSNVRKHSGAPDAIINIEYQEDCIDLMVRDSGRGFDLEKVRKEKRWGSFGLTGMGERVQLLKGTFDIKTSPGSGTQILVSVPTNLNVAEDEQDCAG